MTKPNREALVVGINKYPVFLDEKGQSKHLVNPANDAEEIAKILEENGNFKVQRLPEKQDEKSNRGVDPVQKTAQQVTVEVLEKAITCLFNDTTLDTALIFFAGHGLYKKTGEVIESFLATSDANKKEKWGVSLRWLREILQKSPVRQQIVWLDCCHSGSLIKLLHDEPGKLLHDKVDPGINSKQKESDTTPDRCLISACRDYEVTGEKGKNGKFTTALLKGLRQEVDEGVNNEGLAKFVYEEFLKESQHPTYHNSGKKIILIANTKKAQSLVNVNRKPECPYQSLNYFKEDKAIFFHGRTYLTDTLIDKVRTGNFIAVLGASGSGKSSVLRAGLLYQLKSGQKLSVSKSWKYYEPFTPGEHPLESLRKAIGDSLPDLSWENPLETLVAQLNLDSRKYQRVILVVDQFEECFTMCQDKQEREKFFQSLLGAVEKLEDKLCLVLGIRADFLGRCLEDQKLGQKIDQNLVTVKPMTREEIEEAIKKPAELVGVNVDPVLVNEMTRDVMNSEGSLPLLQYALTELWKETQDNSAEQSGLKLETYRKLGEKKSYKNESSDKKPTGIEVIFSNLADKVFDKIKEIEKSEKIEEGKYQSVAQRIFLELRQPGDVSDTRRRVVLEKLPNKKYDLETLLKVVDILVKERLITSNYIQEKKETILDLVHESLIRHWPKLREWIEEYKVAIEIERKIEARANEWKDWQKENENKKDDPSFLLKGEALIEVEKYLQNYGDLGFLDGLAEEYIERSQEVRDQENAELKKAHDKSKMWEQYAKTLKLLPVEPSEALALAIDTIGLNFQQLPQEAQSSLKDLAQDTKEILGVVQVSLHEVMTKARLITTFEKDSSYTQAVAFSLDGKMIVSGGYGETLELWDIYGNQIGEPWRGHSSSVTALALSQDGQKIVSGSWDKTLRLWNINGDPIGEPWKGHDGSINAVAFSPDGKTIVSASNDETLRLWEINGSQIGEPWQQHESNVKAVAFSPNGKMIVSGSDDNTLRLWDIDGKPIGEPLRGHTGGVNAVAFSPNGNVIVSGSDDKTLRLWDTHGNSIGEPLRGHTDEIKSVAFSPDGQMVVSGADNDNLRLWDINSNLIVSRLRGDSGDFTTVAFSLDGQKIAFGGNYNTLHLWDITNRNKGDVKQVVINRNNHEVYFRSYGISITAVAVSRDGQKIVSAIGDRYSFDGSKENTLCLWDIEGNPIGKPWQGHEARIEAVAFSPDGEKIISGSNDETLRLWDINGNPIGEPLRGHKGNVNAVAFSPNGNMIVSGSDDKTLRLWDINGNPIGEPLRGHKGNVNAVAFSPDGKMFVSGSDDNTLCLWKINGEPIGQPWRGHEDSVNAVAFSLDGQIIVSGSKDKTLRLWDINGNEITQPLRGHEDSVNAVALSQDGKMIVSVSGDGTLYFWPADNWQTWLQVCCDRFAYHLMWKYPEIDLAYNEQGSGSEGVSSARNPQQTDGTMNSQNDENNSVNNQTPEFDIAQRACKVCVKYIWNDADLSKISRQQGNLLGRRGQVEEAIAKFQQALKYNPTLELDPQAEARKLAAPTFVEKGEPLARQGKIEEAIANYDQAQAFDPNLKISAMSWNELCWFGTLHGYANNPKIVAAGEKAVEYEPENANYRDTRGLARASVGNLEGVIEDFQVFIDWTDNEKKKLQRQGWIDALRAGQNPITPEELNKLLNPDQ
ncbi:MAG: caspase family protein [Nostoc sp. CreGUA01]